MQGAIADSYGLKTHKSYSNFLRQEKRSRHKKALLYYGRANIGDAFSIDSVLHFLAIEIDIDRAVASIMRHRDLGYGRKVLKKPLEEIEIITIKNDQKVNFDALRKTMTRGEFDQILTSQAANMKGYIREACEHWLASRVSSLLVASLKAKKAQLERYDHGRVAAQFLQKKYHLAHKGIFPTPALKAEIRPDEVYKYFFENKKKFLVTRAFSAQFTRVADERTAQLFLRELKAGKSFFSLTKTYSVSRKYWAGGRKRRYRVKEIEEDVSTLTMRKYIESVALRAAVNKETEPFIRPIKKQYYVFQISGLQYESEDLDMKDYRESILHMMQEEIFQKQFASDMQLNREKLGFTVDL